MKIIFLNRIWFLFVCILTFFISNKLFPQYQTPEVVVQLGHPGGINLSEFSPDGKYILACSKNGIKLWEVSTGTETKIIQIISSMKIARFSPNNKSIALSGFNSPSMKIINIDNTGDTIIFKGHRNFVNCLCFSKDGKYIVSGGRDSTVKIWNANSGEELKSFNGHKGIITSVFMTPDGKTIVSGSYYDKTIRLWEISSGNEIKVIKINCEYCGDGLSFSQDGKQFCYFSQEKTVELIDLIIGEKISTFNIDERGSHLTYSPDGKMILVNGDALYDINSGKLIKSLKSYNYGNTSFSSMTDCFSPDGNFIFTGYSEGTGKLWDANNGAELKYYKSHCKEINTLCVSPDGKNILDVNGNESIKLWDLYLGKEINTFKDFLCFSTAFSNDGKYFASLGWDLKFRTFPDCNVSKTLSYDKRLRVDYMVTYSNDSKRILQIGTDSVIRVLDLSNDKETIKLIHNPRAFAGYFSRDDKYIVTVGSLSFKEHIGYLKLWDSYSGKELMNFKSSQNNNIFSVDFSPDGKNIIFGGNINIEKLDVNSGKQIETFNGHEFMIMAVKYSPDGKYIASGSLDNTVKLWDASIGKEITTFYGHTSGISSLSFTPDGKYIISGSSDGTIKIWDLQTYKEVISFISLDENDFISITPDKYYLSSKHGYRAIAFVIDNHAIPPEQFDLQYNRPDIVLGRIGYADPKIIEAYRKAYEKRLKKMKFDEEMFNKDFHMPEMKILNQNIQINTTEKNLSLKIKADDSKYLLDRINIYINDVAIYGTDGINLRDKHISTYDSDLNLELSEGKNKIQVSVLNEKGVESMKETVDINYESQKKKHDLYVITIGASDYNDSRYKLRYAAKDANDIADLMLSQKDKYNDVKITKLLDKDVTKENIKKIKESLMQSQVDDEVIVFIAGHGLLTDKFDYYYATADIDFSNPETRGVTFEEIENLLDGIPTRQKVLFMDTCHSGELDKEDLKLIATNEKTQEKGDIIFRSVEGTKVVRKDESESFGIKNVSDLMQEMFVDLRRGSGTAVISSSGGLEVSFEGGEYKNGFFTYSIIEGIKTMKADLNEDGVITVSELRDYVSDKVEKLTKGAQKPTSRKENLENDFRVW